MIVGPCGRRPVLTLELDLFGNFAVTRQWGSVGTTGRVITEPFETELEAAEAMERARCREAQAAGGRPGTYRTA